MAYLYQSNNDPLNHYEQLEIQRDTGETVVLKMGHVYELTAAELARARPYITLVTTSAPAEALGGIYRLPIRGNPANGQVPVWDTAVGAFTPQTTAGLATNVLQAYAPAPSGDTSGATDTAAITALLTAGYHVLFPDQGAQSTYYINATLPLALFNGWTMPASVTLQWVGAAGGSVASTVPYTSTAQETYWGSLRGGRILYPFAKITATTKVVYLAQPTPDEISTQITTGLVENNSYVAGSAGYVFDSNFNPGEPSRVYLNVQGQFEQGCYCRTSHVTFIGPTTSFCRDGIVIDQDSLGSASAPIDIVIQNAHPWECVRSMVRIIQAQQVSMIGGTLENSGIGTAKWLYVESTFTGRCMVLFPYALAVSTTPQKITSFSGNGSIFVIDPQANNAGVWVGQGSGIIFCISTIAGPTHVYGIESTGYSTSSTTDIICLIPLGSVASPPASRLFMEFIGDVVAATDGHPVVLKLWHSPTAAGVVGSAPTSISGATQQGWTLTLTGGTRQVAAAMQALVASLAGTNRVFLSVASPDGVSVTVKGTIRTFHPY